MSGQSAAYRKKWAYDRRHGVLRLIDAEPARLHVCGLLIEGASVRGIAEAAGVSAAAVSRLRLGKQAKIQRPIARALRSVTMAQIISRPNGAGFVPNLGARRRIEALLAFGWRHEDINSATGQGRSQVILHQVGDWISRDNHDAIARAYLQLSGRRGPSLRTAGRAVRLGYAPPAAWDDDTIDDPAATPQHQVVDIAGTGVDEAAVKRRLNGDHSVELTRAERWIVVRRLHSEGHSDNEIARLGGLIPRTVLRDRHVLGLPANFVQNRVTRVAS